MKRRAAEMGFAMGIEVRPGLRSLLWASLASGLLLGVGIGHAQDRGSRSMPAPQAAHASAGAAPAPEWVVDPANPGDDLPLRGRSLFDDLIARGRASESRPTVPFPFESLLSLIEGELPRASQPSTSTAVKAVLIPVGRSLQRGAAAPEFFAYPRAVVAVDSEPATMSALVLKDRLFVAYQEKADQLEVISYNEDAARFEFEVVTDYRAGGVPRIAYANRLLCVACHQNAAPIFSRQVWDETNANPKVAALLGATRRAFYGIPVDRGVDVPNAIDDAVLRANRFAAYQLLWQEGCGGGDERAVRCRAALFVAVLQFRLSGERQFDRAAVSYRDGVAATLARVGRARWPAGLAIGDPDLPNRNPLGAEAPLSPADALRAASRLVHVAAAFDPLRLRAPQEIWHVDDDDAAARLVIGLSELIAAPDVLALDRALFVRASDKAASRRMLRAKCRVADATAIARQRRIDFRCASESPVAGSGLFAEGRLMVSGATALAGSIDRLEINAQRSLGDVDVAGSLGPGQGTMRVARLSLARGALHARGADGNALERAELRWRADGDGEISLTVLDDFGEAQALVATLVRDDLAGRFDGFDAAAFRRARLMPAILYALQVPISGGCCADVSRDAATPAQRAARQLASTGGSAMPVTSSREAHAIFYRYCGECHLGADTAPPSFLSGDADAVEAKLRHCAPRMLIRLGMWKVDDDVRAKSPMPPEVALRRLHVPVDAWRDGDALNGLLRSVGDRLRAEGSGPVALEALSRQQYETLRPCLPENAGVVRDAGHAPYPDRSPSTASMDR